MKVVLVSRGAHPLHGPGGMERAVYLQARHLQAAGVETTLVTRPAERAVDEPFPGRVITVPYGGSPRAHGRVLDRTLRYPAFARRAGAVVAGLVRRGEADVIDAQGLAALGYAEARHDDPALRAPLVMNPQGMEEHKTRGLKRLALIRLRALSRRAARLADRVVATDLATRDEVPRLLGVDAARVVVLPNGVDLEAIAALTPADPAAQAARVLPALAGAAPVFLSVGRLEPYKGYEDVLAALRALQERRSLPPTWRWVVVGEGPLAGSLDRPPASIAAHVSRVGAVDDATLHALYARTDVFVHATRYEGSSLVTLEAMAHGLPVVATRAGGIPDKVEHGVTGWLVEPGDVSGLAGALAAAVADEARRNAAGAAGARVVREKFAWPVLVRRTIALYEDLLREARG